MGISTTARLMVGLMYEDLEDWVNENRLSSDEPYGNCEDPIDVLERLDLTIASPYYDAGYENSFIGIEVEDCDIAEIVCDRIKIAAKQFEKLTGIIGTVHAAADVG